MPTTTITRTNVRVSVELNVADAPPMPRNGWGSPQMFQPVRLHVAVLDGEVKAVSVRGPRILKTKLGDEITRALYPEERVGWVQEAVAQAVLEYGKIMGGAQ